MEAQAHAEPMPQAYLAWQDDYSDQKKSAIFVLRQNTRAIVLGVAGLSAALILGYWATKSSSETIALAPSAPVTEKTSQPIVRSSSEMESLLAAISEQNATNQQIVTALDALRAEQHELRKQITATQAARQSAAITGSIGPRPQPKAFPAKKVEQSDARPVPYPDTRQVPYPRPN
jgi:hypothetical protein